MCPQSGRPKSENPKNIRYSIRFDSLLEYRLTEYCKKLGLKKGEVIRRAVIMLLDAEK